MPAARVRREQLLLWLAVAIALAAGVTAIEPLPVGVFYDDAQYVILAKSLATGQGYRFLNLPGAPAATHFPPGYPLLLALLWRIAPAFPENVALFKLANAVLLAVVAAVAFRFARRPLALPAPLAFVATLAGTATVPALVLSSSVMSEPLFLALLLPLLALIERGTQADGAADGAAPGALRTAGRGGLRAAGLVGAAIAAVTLVRAHGIVLVPVAAALYLACGARRAALVCTAAAVAVLAPWFAWVQHHDAALPAFVQGAYGSYTTWFVAGVRDGGLPLVVGAISDNVATIVWTIARCLVPAGRPALEVLAVAAFAVLSAAAVPVLWRRARALLLFLALYLVVVLVWPFSPLRFVWGIWPLIVLCPAVGAHALWGDAAAARRPSPRRVVAGAAAAIVGIGTVWLNVAGYTNAWWAANGRFHARRILGQLSWVEGASRPSDVVASDAEGAVYLYTGRRTVPATSFTAAEYVTPPTDAGRVQILRDMLATYSPAYVLVASAPLVAAADRIAAADTALLARIDTIPRGAAYRHRQRAGGRWSPRSTGEQEDRPRSGVARRE
jgi:hypothetical protein